MGSGRCGTVSLYRLLNLQKNSFFTHESKPLLTWKFDKKSIDKKLKKILAKPKKYVGDVNSCYLPYVDYICKNYSSAKIVVLKRPKEEVVESFMRKKEIFGHQWISKKGKEGKWEKMFPKSTASTKEEAIKEYWEDYYIEVSKLMRKHPKNVKLFETQALNSKRSVKAILGFCSYMV